MKKLSTLSIMLVLTSTSLLAGPLLKAVVLDNNGRPSKSVANKAVKVNVAKKSIDKNDTVVGKVVKGKMIRGDYRVKRQIRNR